MVAKEHCPCCGSMMRLNSMRFSVFILSLQSFSFTFIRANSAQEYQLLVDIADLMPMDKSAGPA
jgi:hypothetical protein